MKIRKLRLNSNISQFVDKTQLCNHCTGKTIFLIHRYFEALDSCSSSSNRVVHNERSWTFLLDSDQRPLHRRIWQPSIQMRSNVQCWHQISLPDYSLVRNQLSQVHLDLVHTSLSPVIINWHLKTVFNVFTDGSGFTQPSTSNGNSKMKFFSEKPLVGR